MAYLDEMNVKANEQDTVGTDYDLRDKDLNAATAKTSVASTDGVVLKGTDGSYHTIDRSSFTEAVRSVIGGILNNMASKGTAVKGVSVIDNSNDFGLTTPSDLASVLGVRVLNADANTDANVLASAYNFSVVKFNESSIDIDAAHIPTRYGVLVTFSTTGISGSATVYIQLFAGGYGGLWFRHFSWSSSSPSEWVNLT